jgi:hypothetical protein
MVGISEIKIDKTMNSLKGLKKATPAMIRAMVRTVCSKSKKYIRKEFRSKMKSRTGETSKSIKHKVYPDGHGVVYVAARPKGYVNITGATIFPKTGKFLYFTGRDGQLRRVKSVTIPGRDWFEPPIVKYLKSGEPLKAMQDKLDKGLEKQWKK